ncbi:MAG: NTP transferase domain-containing protein [Planctomycetia bacterium]|nr:NTP transferase domain-containing protein [Planctomycetia bacterium]
MKAIILSAGVSRRLYPLTLETPKSLLKVKNKPILDYQLDALRTVGIKEIILVLGYYKDLFIEHFKKNHSDFKLSIVMNHHFFETNTAYSAWLCKDSTNNDEIVLMNADVLYPVELMSRLVNSKQKNVLAVEIKKCGREEVKVVEGEGKRIVTIGKELIQENSLGEFIGVAKFSNEFMKSFFSSLDKLISAGGKSDYFEAAINPLLSTILLYYEDVSDLPCKEIDFIEDLEDAKLLIESKFYK